MSGPALAFYLSLQAADELSTRHALAHGAHEGNPAVSEQGRRLAVKAASAAALTFVDRKLQKRSRKAVWIFRGATFLAYGAITAHNLRTARKP